MARRRSKGRKGEEADEIVNAALKPLDLLSGIFGWRIHVSHLREATCSTWCVVRETHAETPRRHKERVVLKYAADDDHRMRAHDVDHRVSSKFRKIVNADDRVVVAAPHIVNTRFELDEIVDVRSTFRPPSPCGRRCG